MADRFLSVGIDDFVLANISCNNWRRAAILAGRCSWAVWGVLLIGLASGRKWARTLSARLASWRSTRHRRNSRRKLRRCPIWVAEFALLDCQGRIDLGDGGLHVGGGLRVLAVELRQSHLEKLQSLTQLGIRSCLRFMLSWLTGIGGLRRNGSHGERGGTWPGLPGMVVMLVGSWLARSEPVVVMLVVIAGILADCGLIGSLTIRDAGEWLPSQEML